MVKDPRFDTSQWQDEPEASTSQSDEEEVIEAGDASNSEGFDTEEDRVIKPLSKEELESFEKKEKKKGIVYISRIPYGMTVSKVRHLLSGFGDVDRIFLQDGREKERGEKMTGRRSKSAHFTEGWVEFQDKKVAKAVAEMLNAESIGAASDGSGGGKGGKKAGGMGARRWRDEVWTMKYLGGFKWGMLSEQLANERASRASRVRAELSQSAYEQKDYLKKVERARVMREKEERRKARESKGNTDSSDKVIANRQQPAKERTFKQREAIVKDVREQRKRPNEANAALNSKKSKLNGDDANSQALQSALSMIF